MNQDIKNKPNIHYADSIKGGSIVKSKLLKTISNQHLQEICDIGGGANPILDENFILKNQLNHTLLDISQTELDKAAASYTKIKANILDATSLPSDKWDFMYSCALAEHLENGKVFHENVYKCLKPGGYAFHVIPTFYCIPFMVNRFFPESLSSIALNLFAPRNRHQHEKFKAYYNWCYGPTPKMLSMLNNIGYEIVDYQGFFGHLYYRKIKPLQFLNDQLTKFLVKHPNPYFTSYAHIVIKKP